MINFLRKHQRKIDNFGIGVNIFGSFMWYFNYYMTSLDIHLIIGSGQLFLAVYVLTKNYKIGNIKK